MTGDTILHYKVLDKLGEGGMGVVYKARDTKLNRTVALKFLPANLTTSREDIERFNQEARSAATLNHPNICTVYTIEQQEDKQFIVMEYIDGTTLGKMNAGKPLAINDALSYSIQIGEALQEAHSNNIVHRDIKSENIMVNSKNRIKVMDFGLAKLKGSVKLTKTSSTVGTLAYMAPEQIQGGETDARSDIFSFGVVLFEMLTGEIPFRGEHDASLMYSILNEEPKDINKFVPDLCPIVINLIQRCLEKDPEDRYQTMADAVIELKRAKKKTGPVLRSPVHRAEEHPVDSNVTSSGKINFSGLIGSRVFMISIAIIILITSAVIWWFSGSSLPEINPNKSVSVLQVPSAEFGYAGISPDGKMLAIPGADANGKWDIYIMDIQLGESRRLTTDSSKFMGAAAYAQFSPDGRTIAFGRLNTKTNSPEVCDISILGGLTRVIADTGLSPHWNPAGTRIFYFRGISPVPGRSGWREYWSVSPYGDDARIEFIDSLAAGKDNHFTFSLSPDGNKIAFTRPFKGNFNEIIIRNLETGKEKRLTYDRKIIDEVDWLNNGYIFYSSNRTGNFNIWAIPEDGGKPKQVTSGAGPDYGITMSTRANRLVFLRRSLVGTLWRVGTDGSDNRQIFPDVNIGDAIYSSDGNRVVLLCFDQFSGGSYIILRNLNSGHQETLVPFDSTATYRLNLTWSPSGHYIAYSQANQSNSPSESIKVLDLSTGDKPHDFGHGALLKWISDSVAVIMRTDSINGKTTVFTPKLLNLRTRIEKRFFRDSSSAIAMPVLNGNRYIYSQFPVEKISILSKKELENNPEAKGKVILKGNETSDVSFSDKWIYYKKDGAIWRMNFKTLRTNKILDIPAGSKNIDLCSFQNNDKVLHYVRFGFKTNLMKIDNLFSE